MRMTIAAALAAALATGLAAAASAATFTLTDAAATATVTSRNGVTVWRTDGGRDNVFISNWYLRRAGEDGELPLSEAIAFPTASQPAPGTLELSFDGAPLSAALRYDLIGGEPGSRRSTLRREATLTNAGDETLSLFLFDYTDFDIRFDQLDQRDQSVLEAPGVIRTRSASFPLEILTRVSPAPQQWEIADFFTLYTRFFIDLDGATTLPNTPAIGEPFPTPPGYNAFAFGWEFDLAPGARFTALHESTIAPIPAPAALPLLATGLFALRAAARRRRAR